MILVRFRRTFRERAPEWVLAFILWGWGFILLLPGESFNRPFFRPLLEVGSEIAWGSATCLIGTIRIAALYVNGSREETPRIRQAGSFFGMLVWAFLTSGAMSVEWHSPAIFTYAGLFALEAIMFSYSGADAARVAFRATQNGGG
ncbi:hypothetical protein [Sphingomonas sp.]|uniref:hypothetical protein n=1 Tax=Sphingomonas sp. TaxID=28214 RepID=UPI003B00D74F